MLRDSCEIEKAFELPTPGSQEFDVILIDYALGFCSGISVAEKIATQLPHAPIILVSQTSRVPKPGRWPANIREFVHKKFGPYAILEAATEAFEIALLQSERHEPRS